MENSEERLSQQARPGIELGNSSLPVFERRAALPLVGPRMDNFTTMPHPGSLVQ